MHLDPITSSFSRRLILECRQFTE